MESVLFRREDVWRRFVDSREAADAVRPVMCNQGFYNLFLAIGAGVGALLLAIGGERCVAGLTLVGFACASMVGASIVLLATDHRRFRTAALVKGVPALVAVIAVVVIAGS